MLKARFEELHQVWLKNATKSRFFLAEYDRLYFLAYPCFSSRLQTLKFDRRAFFWFLSMYSDVRRNQKRSKPNQGLFLFLRQRAKSALRSFSKSLRNFVRNSCVLRSISRLILPFAFALWTFGFWNFCGLRCFTRRYWDSGFSFTKVFTKVFTL